MSLFQRGDKIVSKEQGYDENGIVFPKGLSGIIVTESDEFGDGFYDIEWSDGNKSFGAHEKYLEGFGISNVHLAVNAKLDADEKTKEIKDSENRIIFAKKYKAAYTKINLQTLTDIEENPGLAEMLVIKDKVFEKIDIEKQQINGVSSPTAWLKNNLRTVFPQKPNKSSAEARRVYMYYVQYIQANIINGPIQTPDQFKSAIILLYKNTINNYMVAVDETGMMEEKIANQEEVLSERIREGTEKLMSSTGKLEKYEAELIEKYGEAAIDKSFDVKNMYHIKGRYISAGTDEEKIKYEELADIVIDEYKNVKYLSKEELIPIMREAVMPEKPEAVTMDSYRYRSYVERLLNEIFGEKFQNYLRSDGGWSTKSQKGSYYTQAEKFGIASEHEIRYASEKLDKLKQSLIDWNLYKTAFQSKDPNKIREAINAAIIIQQSIKAGTHEGAYIPFAHKAFTYKYFNGKNIFLALSSDGFQASSAQIVKSPDNADEYLFFADKALELIVKEETRTNAEIEATKQVLERTEENWSWSGVKKGKTGTKKVDIRINSQTPLDHIERTNALKIPEFTNDAEIKGFFNETLGIDRITYGKYVPDDERQAHAFHFGMSMVDFCEVLNWNIHDFTFQLDLGIAIGAAGSGSASAFYMSSPAAFINLTRRRGDGSLAHELTHYIDNFTSNDRQSHHMATEWDIGSARSRYVSRARTTDSDTLNNLLFDLILFIKFGSPPSYIDQELVKRYREYHKDSKMIMIDNGVKNKATKGSIYYLYCSALSGYWIKNWEMFARASECFIFDQMKEKNMFNNYLVSGEYFESPYGVYPMGPEREICNVIIKNIFAEIKKLKEIGDFSFATSERIDNFIALKTGKEDSEVEQDEVEFKNPDEYNRKHAEKNLDILIGMLNKYETGGPIESIIELNKKYQYGKAG